MVFQLNFKGPYHNIRTRFGKVLVYVICMAYFCILDTFQSKRMRRSKVILC